MRVLVYSTLKTVIDYRPPKLKSIPIARAAEKPSSTMANLPAHHRLNTHPAPSDYFRQSHNTSSRYYTHFSASDADATSD
eukprot:scaffold14819_cov65-Cyclotella_meneghiniana.AAC.1